MQKPLFLQKFRAFAFWWNQTAKVVKNRQKRPFLTRQTWWENMALACMISICNWSLEHQQVVPISCPIKFFVYFVVLYLRKKTRNCGNCLLNGRQFNSKWRLFRGSVCLSDNKILKSAHYKKQVHCVLCKTKSLLLGEKAF